MDKSIAKLATESFKGIKRVIAFDTETTGLKPKDERIVELAFKMWEDGKLTKEFEQRFNPEKPMPAAAQRVNGISDEDLKDMPLFKDFAKELREIYTEDTVYIGYNVDYDLDMIRFEFKRCGEKDLVHKNCKKIDPLTIWKENCPKKRLVDAYKTFVGGELKNAHSALADIDATVEVLFNMSNKFGLDNNTDDLSASTNLGTTTKKNNKKSKSNNSSAGLDSDDRFIWENNDIICNFGKNRGQKLKEMDKGYLSWMVDKGGFTKEVNDLVTKVIKGQELPQKA